MRIALGIEYDGSAYCGWQHQDHCDAVQTHVEAALSFVADHPIEVVCAGRTDTGVHALNQVVHFDTTAERPLRAWVEGVNTRLPDAIRIHWVKPVAEDFDARFSAVARRYRYVIHNVPTRSALLRQRVTWVREPLDAAAMDKAAQALVGEQDFSSFRAAGCQARHPMREVQRVHVHRQGNMVLVDIQANAFLHHMVRNIVGSLLKVGQGERPVEWIAELLAAKDRTQAAETAPAAGLYFVTAVYPPALGIAEREPDCVVWRCA
ncbi:tRNA pseudouridine38-40 synthase [Sulfurivirga caldicuralii]|uniref:tRNA pseudouridine synthase A n=1 Tax=Sulfurivirga caldicuralii TaxID=364032 RepID=A0A1N6ES57_9GAMM|nr:tRNA pseudouridine(38-40) synthase TruA [Sulfurivirga caldicuralii]SIN85856.1 tRNA pseudouridine38-40 synthase [Sulfurivirga caldicuralii]